IPSPSLVVWHGPPNPENSVLVLAGPNWTVPDLENTANPVLTISTNWVAPTAEFGSGGAPVMLNVPPGPEKPWPRPSKLAPRVGASTPGVVCTTGSATGCRGCGSRPGTSFSSWSPEVGFGAMVRSAG